MPGARSIVAKGEPEKVFKRGGPITKTEKDFVAQFLQDQTRELTTSQVTSLSKVLRRSKEAIRTMVEDARDNFAESAGLYVNIHKEATIGALKSEDYEIAIKGSQWAIEHLGMEGVRLIEKTSAQPTGNKIMIGIRIGGVDAAKDMEMPEIIAEAVSVE